MRNKAPKNTIKKKITTKNYYITRNDIRQYIHKTKYIFNFNFHH